MSNDLTVRAMVRVRNKTIATKETDMSVEMTNAKCAKNEIELSFGDGGESYVFDLAELVRIGQFFMYQNQLIK